MPAAANETSSPVLLFDVFKTLVLFNGDHVADATFVHDHALTRGLALSPPLRYSYRPYKKGQRSDDK